MALRIWIEEHQDMNPKPNTLADLYRELPKGRRCSLIYGNYYCAAKIIQKLGTDKYEVEDSTGKYDITVKGDAKTKIDSVYDSIQGQGELKEGDVEPVYVYIVAAGFQDGVFVEIVVPDTQLRF
tara:strand:+ start:1506 stop:1877 length:372 start_codon:yes stop_codon:yes gene_type:complete